MFIASVVSNFFEDSLFSIRKNTLGAGNESIKKAIIYKEVIVLMQK